MLAQRGGETKMKNSPTSMANPSNNYHHGQQT